MTGAGPSTSTKMTPSRHDHLNKNRGRHSCPPELYKNRTSKQENTGINIDKKIEECKEKLISNEIPEELLNNLEEQTNKKRNLQDLLHNIYNSQNDQEQQKAKNLFWNRCRNLACCALSETSQQSDILEECEKKISVISQLTNFAVLCSLKKFKQNTLHTNKHEIDKQLFTLKTKKECILKSIKNLIKTSKKYNQGKEVREITQQLYDFFNKINNCNSTINHNQTFIDVGNTIDISYIKNQKKTQMLNTFGTQWKTDIQSENLETLKKELQTITDKLDNLITDIYAITTNNVEDYKKILISQGISEKLLDACKDAYKKEGNGVQGALQGLCTKYTPGKSIIKSVTTKLCNIVLSKLPKPELPSNNILEACRKNCRMIHQLTRFLALDAATQLENNPTIGHQTTTQQVEPAIKMLRTYHQDYPDSVYTLLELEEKAETHNCKKRLDDILKELHRSLQNVNTNQRDFDNIIWPDIESIINNVLDNNTSEILSALGKKWKPNADPHDIENLKSVIREFDDFVQTALSSPNPTVTPQSDSSRNSIHLPTPDVSSNNMTVLGIMPAPRPLYYNPNSIW